MNEERKKAGNWWWIAYEEVYLAVIRRNQGNIVEAFFHSFRAFEGIFAAWGGQYLDGHIEFINEVPYLSLSALDDTDEENLWYRLRSKLADFFGPAHS